MLKPMIHSNLRSAPAGNSGIASFCDMAGLHAINSDEEDHEGNTVIVD